MKLGKFTFDLSIESEVKEIDEFFIDVHERFCKEYGYVSPEKFLDMWAPMVFNFIAIWEKRDKELKKASKGKK